LQEGMKNSPYAKQIREPTDTEKVYLSLRQFDWQKIPELVSCADIGVVLCENWRPNY
jgi:hypothetical protein